MPFYDLNVPWAEDNPAELQRTLIFLKELGYNVVALSHTLSGKLPNDLTPPIPETLPVPLPNGLHTLTRVTLPLTSNAANHRLPALQSSYDILALRPTNQKTFEQACRDLECDVISLDLTGPPQYQIRAKTIKQAVERGVGVEICYAPAVLANDAVVRRNVITNATAMIRATGGKGIILSSEARRASGCRGPADVINMAAIWGLAQERGKDALESVPRKVLATAALKRESYRGIVRVVRGGEKVVPQSLAGKGKTENANVGSKRKAEAMSSNSRETKEDTIAKPPSKRELKRRKKAEEQAKREARMQGDVG